MTERDRTMRQSPTADKIKELLVAAAALAACAIFLGGVLLVWTVVA